MAEEERRGYPEEPERVVDSAFLEELRLTALRIWDKLRLENYPGIPDRDVFVKQYIEEYIRYIRKG